MTNLKHTPPTPPDDLATRSSRLAGVALLIFLFVGLLSSGRLIVSGQISLLPDKVLTPQILDGDITHRIAKELSNAQLPTTFAELERGASWLLLGDTGPRVRSGCPDWLFLADELKVNDQAQRNADAKVQAVIDLKQQLS
ncbi:MAG: cell division protein FtsQ, partial [Pseudomonas sp.]